MHWGNSPASKDIIYRRSFLRIRNMTDLQMIYDCIDDAFPLLVVVFPILWVDDLSSWGMSEIVFGYYTKKENIMAPFIHLICDYAPGDLAWSEVYAAMVAQMPDSVRMHMTAVHSFDTIATGFAVAQLGLASSKLCPAQTIIFANCAPRKDNRKARANNEGEGLLYGVLSTGIPVVAVNSGYSLSFVKHSLKELWQVKVEEEGSQFRSRDFFPSILAQLVRGDLTFRGKALPVHEVVRDYPEEVVAYIDSFGNLKTSIATGDKCIADLQEGDRLRVHIGTVVRTATVSTGSFNVMEGDLAFAPGSSGHNKRYWEFFQRGGSAWADFGKPNVGSNIVIEKIS